MHNFPLPPPVPLLQPNSICPLDDAMSSISFNVTADQSSQFFGKLIVSNIQANDPVKVNKYFIVNFKSPAHIGNSDFNGVTHPWVDITPDISNQQIGTMFLVTAKLNFHDPYTFNGQETFTFYINGDLGSDPAQKQYTETFTLATD